MSFEKELEKLAEKKKHVLAMGGKDKIAGQHAKGKYTARERINLLLDPDTFFEIGMFAHSDMPGMADKTPSDSKIAGYGKISDRRVAVLANDFTVMAATSSRIAGRKEGELKQYAIRKGIPVIYLGEAGGARMPDIMGSKGLSSFGGGGFDTYLKIMSRDCEHLLYQVACPPGWPACLTLLSRSKALQWGFQVPGFLKWHLARKSRMKNLAAGRFTAGLPAI